MKATLSKAVCAALFLLPSIAAAAEVKGGKKQTLIDVYKEGGWVMHFLLACSIAMVWLLIDIWLRTNRTKMPPRADVVTAQKPFRAGDYVGAYQAMKAGVSPFCEVIRAGLGSVG